MDDWNPHGVIGAFTKLDRKSVIRGHHEMVRWPHGVDLKLVESVYGTPETAYTHVIDWQAQRGWGGVEIQRRRMLLILSTEHHPEEWTTVRPGDDA